MTYIGKPQRIIIAEPLELPAPLRKDVEVPQQDPAVPAEEPEPAHVTEDE